MTTQLNNNSTFMFKLYMLDKFSSQIMILTKDIYINIKTYYLKHLKL